MCTALVHQNLFGRTLDLERSYEEQVVIVPRRFPLPFRAAHPIPVHHAIIGMAHVEQGYPLFYDALNEKGLAMAALNFPVSAAYQTACTDRDNIAPFELIPWVLSRCESVTQACSLLAQTNLLRLDFSPRLPATPLHWLIADREQTVTVEPLPDGLHIYKNPVGVLTNEPPFPMQLSRLQDFLALSPQPPENRFAPSLPLTPYSRGMGALGLPGDWSSPSRFVRAVFAAHNSLCSPDSAAHLVQFFRVMACVEVPRGCVRLEDGQSVITVYTSCCDLEQGVYYYTTYSNPSINGVSLHRASPDGSALSLFPLVPAQPIPLQNK